MSTAWARKFGTEIDAKAARWEIAKRVQQCDVEGCTGLVMDGTRCNDCIAELEALEQNLKERERIALELAWREQERRERTAALAKAALECWLLFWDWLKCSRAATWVLTVFVVLAWGYECFKWSRPLVEWLAGVK